MLKNISLFFVIFLLEALTNTGVAQSIIDEIDEPTSYSAAESELFEERITKISPSRRIFILTNENNGYNKGDFISLILGDKLVCRAISAKMANGVSGIKIVKIYSMALWTQLAPGMTVKVLRGDDSYFGKSKIEEEKTASRIEDEEDLYNDTVLNEDIDLEEKTNRLIRPDNIIGLTYGTVSSVDIDRNTTPYFILNGSWSYQLADNVWGDFSFGQTVVRDFPNLSLDTTLTNLSFRIKYIVNAPFDSYIKPYFGFQMLTASSPSAGQDTTKSAAILEEELELVSQAGRSGIIFGVTFLKRLVPAWFIKVDIGSDMMAGGLALEF